LGGAIRKFMTQQNDYIRLFPEYSDVFYDDVDIYRQYFLPLASVNLQVLYPGRNEWLHFVSVKEVYDGSVGENTTAYHTRYTLPDTLGFDVIDGKYRFDADWQYFKEHRYITPNSYHPDHTDAEIAWNMNEAMYQLKKAYYQEFGQLYNGAFDRPGLLVKDIRKLERLRALTTADLHADDVDAYIEETRLEKTAGIFTKLAPGMTPDLEESRIPLREDGQPFDFIGALEGYDFQYTPPDDISLFYCPSMKKAVVCLAYS